MISFFSSFVYIEITQHLLSWHLTTIISYSIQLINDISAIELFSYLTIFVLSSWSSLCSWMFQCGGVFLFYLITMTTRFPFVWWDFVISSSLSLLLGGLCNTLQRTFHYAGFTNVITCLHNLLSVLLIEFWSLHVHKNE